jgi:hypothetical protein
LGRLLAAVEGPDWQDIRNGAMLNILARAGLRLSEVLALKLDDVTLNDRSGSLLVRQGKGKKERTVALAKEACAALRAHLDVRPKMAQTDILFISRSWQPLGARDVQRLITEAKRRAGIQKEVTPHTLQHTFATRFLQNGGDVATLASLLGHTNVATTTRHLHPNAARVQEMVEKSVYDRDNAELIKTTMRGHLWQSDWMQSWSLMWKLRVGKAPPHPGNATRLSKSVCACWMWRYWSAASSAAFLCSRNNPPLARTARR